MNIAIWGAGKFGTFMGKQLKEKQSIVCYIDNCAQDIDDKMGIEVVTPTEYMRCYAQKVDMLLVAVRDCNAIYEQIRKMNIKKYGMISKLVYDQKLSVSDDILKDVNILYNDELESKAIHMKKLETNVWIFAI